MSSFLRRFAPVAAILAGILTTFPAHARDTGMPHPMHEYEGWVALAVVVLSLLGAGVLVRRALRR